MKSAILAWILVCVCACSSLIVTDIYYCADQSALIHDGLSILHGHLVSSGPESRGGVHHPGSLYKLLIAFLLAVSGGSLRVFALMHVIILSSSAFFIVRTARILSGSIWFSFSALILFLALPFSFWYTIIVWGPAANVTVMCASLYLAVEIARGKTRLAPLLMICLSFLFQTHYGTIFPVVALGLTGLWNSRNDKKAIYRSFIVGVLFTLPALIDFVREPQNLRMILASARGTQSLSSVWEAMAELHSMNASWIWGLAFALSIVVLLIRRSGEPASRLNAAAWISVCLALASSILSMFFIRERIDPYYVAFLPAITIVLLSAFARRIPIVLSILCLFALPAAVSNVNRYWNGAWNVCPLGEVQTVARALNGKTAETKGAFIPFVLPSILREAGGLHPAKGLLIEAPPADSPGQDIFRGKAIRLLEQPAR